MSKNNIALIVAGILLIVGITLATSGFLSGGSSSVYVDRDGIHTGENHSESTIVPVNNFNNVDIEVNSERIELIPSDRNEVEYVLSNNQTFDSLDVIDGELIIKTSTNFNLSFFNFNFRDNYIKVYYDKDTEFEDVSVQSLSGRVKVDGVNTDNMYVKSSSGSRAITDIKATTLEVEGSSGATSLSNITVNEITILGTSGSIKLDKITTDNMYVKSSSGSRTLTDIKATNLEVEGSSGATSLSNITANEITILGTSGSIKLDEITTDSMGVKSSSGSITAEDVVCSVNLNAKNTSGRIEIQELTTNSMNLGNTSGTIDVEGSLAGESVVTSTSGSVKIDTDLDKSQYGYRLHATSGSTRVDEETFKGSTSRDKENFIDITSTSGSIKLYFSYDD